MVERVVWGRWRTPKKWFTRSGVELSADDGELVLGLGHDYFGFAHHGRDLTRRKKEQRVRYIQSRSTMVCLTQILRARVVTGRSSSTVCVCVLALLLD